MPGSFSISGRKAPRNIQNHIFFAGTLAPARPGILATVTGVDGDDQVAQLRRLVPGLDFLRCARRHRRLRSAPEQVDDQSMAILFVGLEHEALGLDRTAQIEHQAQVGFVAWSAAQPLYDPTAGLHFHQVGLDGGILEIHHQAIRTHQGEQPVFHRAADVQHHARTVRCRPQPYTLHLQGPRLCQGRHQYQK